MIQRKEIGYILSPAYDMVASALVVTGDDEELALTLNGKKKKLRRKDFIEAMKHAGMDDKVIRNTLEKIIESSSKWSNLIEKSFLSRSMKDNYIKMIESRRAVLEI